MAKDYKETLNLPKTDFPMKANLPQKEPEILKFWEENKIYDKLQIKGRKSSYYILHDGPPYANGHIHMGHALNKILKDILVKFKTMKGYYAPFVPGWDCHGLPIELQVDKNLGDKKDKLDILEKRRLCREYAKKFVQIQKEEFKRLGVFGDWENPYLTMSNEYEATIVKEFCKFVISGYIYRGKKPVHWCPSCVTALAEAEVEYYEKESPSIFVKFKISEEDINKYLPKLKDKPVFILIWTTTPWTLPANLALAFHPEFEYIATEKDGEFLIIARERQKALKEKLGLNDNEELIFKGRDILGMSAQHPFIKRRSKIVLAEFVSLEEGTGIVHIAPGHGEDDYEIGLKYGLDIYAPVDRHGKFNLQKEDEPKYLHGKFVFKANSEIIEILKDNNSLLIEEKITHSYPHCWRCKKPVIFRATEQWFISLEKNNLRKRSLAEIDNVIWIPKWGKERIYGMVSNRPDWCISRQRTWGVPITLIRCKNCDEYIIEENILNSIVDITKKHGSDIWFEKDVKELLPPDYKCKKCGSTDFSKETDILDVWFDSGVSHAAVMELDERLSWPADMYLEGSDQHRGWFQSSLITSVGTRGTAPYKTVLTHGFVVDGQGKKMSKSLGNVIAPQEIIKTNGAELLRLWVSAEDYRDDIRLSREIMDRLTEAYRKIRNTCRFLLSNLYDFDWSDYSNHLLEIDSWAMSRLQTFIEKINNAYERYDFHEVFHYLYNFCVTDMSSFYLDILKDRLYTFKADSKERKAAQWVLSNILLSITRIMAPILSFTAEEVWQNIRTYHKKIEESVFLSKFPSVDKSFLNTELEKRWEDLTIIRDEVNKALELKRAEKLIGNSLEAKVIISSKNKYNDLLKAYKDFLPTLFIVSAVELSDERLEDSYLSPEIEGLQIKVIKAPGEKCQRCWNWSESVGSFSGSPDICEKCYRVLFN